MSVQKRKCASCKFFDQAPLPGNGWCTHPKRQQSSDVRILVRSGELACRNSWGGDFWVSNIAASEGENSDGQAVPDRLVARSRADDQITSVTTSYTAQSADPDPFTFGSQGFSRETAPDDVIVSQPSMLPEDARSPAPQHAAEDDQHDLNLPAHEDQRERARIIARGNRDAIVKARERHVLRRGGSERMPISDAADAGKADGKNVDKEQRDDTAEADRFAAGSGPPLERKTGRRPRELRADQGLQSRGYADPTPPVPATEVSESSRRSPLVSRRADADRFESVPEVNPDVALPRLRKFLLTDDPDPDALDGTFVEGAPGQAETTYDLVLRRAQAIKTATQKERNARVIRNRPVMKQVRTSGPAPLPAVPGIDHSESIESPLRRSEDQGLPGDGRHLPATEALRSSDYVTIDAEPDYDGPDDGMETDAYFFDEEIVEEEMLPVQDPTYDRIAARSRIGPQQSWWRGLGLSFGRRSQPYATTASTSFLDANDADDEWGDDELEPPSHWSVEDEDARDGEPGTPEEPDRSSERVFSFANDDRSVSMSTVVLRDSRTAEDELVDYELTDEVLETSFADDSDQVQSKSWHEDGQSRVGDEEREYAYADRSQQDSGFALADRHDMDAFRAVLFGNRPVDTVERQEPVRERRRSQRYQEPSPVPREEIAVSQEHLPMANDVRVAVHERYVEEPVFDIRNFVEQDDDLLDMRVQIAPDVPRACRTCRDFRPSESGERGWCTNDFAFTHRQMVNADDMPCQSSIGCWWLPSDNAWMPREDFATREDPTPFTDRLLARRDQRATGDKHHHSGLYVREM